MQRVILFSLKTKLSFILGDKNVKNSMQSHIPFAPDYHKGTNKQNMMVLVVSVTPQPPIPFTHAL